MLNSTSLRYAEYSNCLFWMEKRPAPDVLGQFKSVTIWCRCFQIALVFCLVNILCVFSAYSIDKTALEILSLLKKEKYSVAVHLMEREIKTSRNNSKKGHYALLLNELPNNMLMTGKRYEYAFIAALYAKNVSERKRVFLWIEAGDGFFESGYLQKADRCYKEALNLINLPFVSKQPEAVKLQQKSPLRPDTQLNFSNQEHISYNKKAKASVAYILYKQAWIYVNQKKWIQAFNLLVQALEQKASRLNDIMLSDLGKIWVESQYFKNKTAFSSLQKVIKNISLEEKEVLIKGMLKGMRRTIKKGIDKIISALAVDQQLSTDTLNLILRDRTVFMDQPCRLLSWMEKSQIKNLDRELTLSVLNSCTHNLTSSKTKKQTQKKWFKSLADLYVKVDRKGIERWPLLLVYSNMGLKNPACDESLRLLIEVTDLAGANTSHEELEKAFSETFQFCKKGKGDLQEIEKAVRTVLRSNTIIQKYANMDNNSWENSLFDFLNLKQIHFVVQKNILQAKEQWRKKDLLPALILSHIDKYQPKEIKQFLNRFSSKPLKKYYLDILIYKPEAVTVEELKQLLPLSKVDSYRKTLPWFKKALANHIDSSQKASVMSKLLHYFPSKKKDRKTVSLFLTINYLKADQIHVIMEHWNKLSSVFLKKNMAIELFEKILYNKNSCVNVVWPEVLKKINHSPLLKFIYQCCRMMKPQGDGFFIMEDGNKKKITHKIPGGFKLPSVLRSSTLAWDFVWLSRTQKTTLWMEKGISQLDNKTSKMIMNLKTAVSRYQKRKWHLKSVAKQMETLLTRQINLFERELTRLANNSPYGEKYKALKNIVSQWK